MPNNKLASGFSPAVVRNNHEPQSFVTPCVMTSVGEPTADAFVKLPITIRTQEFKLGDHMVAPPAPHMLVQTMPAAPAAPATPQSTFESVAKSDPALPAPSAREAAQGLLPLVSKSSEGLKAYYFKHPDTGVLVGSQLPYDKNVAPLEHREIAESLANEHQSREVQRALRRAAIFSSQGDDPERVWGGTRLMADPKPRCSSTEALKLHITPSVKFGHPANDPAINEAVASFYANVCILSDQRADVSASDPSCERVARRVRVKLRTHFGLLNAGPSM